MHGAKERKGACLKIYQDMNAISPGSTEKTRSRLSCPTGRPLEGESKGSHCVTKEALPSTKHATIYKNITIYNRTIKSKSRKPLCHKGGASTYETCKYVQVPQVMEPWRSSHCFCRPLGCALSGDQTLCSSLLAFASIVAAALQTKDMMKRKGFERCNGSSRNKKKKPRGL